MLFILVSINNYTILKLIAANIRISYKTRKYLINYFIKSPKIYNIINQNIYNSSTIRIYYEYEMFLYKLFNKGKDIKTLYPI